MPFSSTRIVRVERGVVWTSGTLSGNRAELATGFDVRTGQQVTSATSGDVGRIGGTVGGVGGVGGAGGRLEEAPRLGIEGPRIPGKPARLCLRDRVTGKETAAVELPGTFRVMPLAFVVDGRNALAVNDRAELVVVDTASLHVLRTVPLPAPETVAKRVTPLLRAGGQSWLVRVDASCGVTEVAPLDSTTGATGTPRVFEGRVVAVEGADSGILLICERALLSLATIASLRPIPVEVVVAIEVVVFLGIVAVGGRSEGACRGSRSRGEALRELEGPRSAPRAGGPLSGPADRRRRQPPLVRRHRPDPARGRGLHAGTTSARRRATNGARVLDHLHARVKRPAIFTLGCRKARRR